MQRKYLISKFDFGGHFLEYLSHIYNYAKQDSQNLYVFALSGEFQSYFSQTSNIKIVLMTEEMLKYYFMARGIYMRDLFENIIIRRLIKKYRITDVIHITLKDIERFLPFLRVKGVNYSGIIYYIYLYRWHNLTYFRKIQERLIHTLLVKPKNIHIYVCNDEFAARLLNKSHRTIKFKYLTDPFVPISQTTVNFFPSQELDGKYVYLHFGALSERKGTIEILKAIEMLNYKIGSKCAFIFAGKVSESISKEFYERIERCKSKTTIIVHDEFCSFEYIDYICKKANYILMPYLIAYQSSGMFGYAAQYGVPVLALDKFLHGRLVRQYHLGFVIPEVNSKAIYSFVSDLNREKYEVPDDYLKSHTPHEFCVTLLS